MIETDAQLEHARQALSRLEGALKALRDRVYSDNPELFEAMAQDYLAGIQQIRGEIDGYLGVTGLDFGRAQLWMTLKGEDLGHRDISSRLLSDWLARLRRAVHGVAV